MVDGPALTCYRARSWIQRATDPRSPMDLDGRFIFLWIAFNALYGQAKYRLRGPGRGPEERDIETFLGLVVAAGPGGASRPGASHLEGRDQRRIRHEGL